MYKSWWPPTKTLTHTDLRSELWVTLWRSKHTWLPTFYKLHLFPMRSL